MPWHYTMIVIMIIDEEIEDNKWNSIFKTNTYLVCEFLLCSSNQQSKARQENDDFPKVVSLENY